MTKLDEKLQERQAVRAELLERRKVLVAKMAEAKHLMEAASDLEQQILMQQR